MTVFIPEFGAKGIWISVFTSVSAFCNAGIDIIAENSLCNYALNPIINIVTCSLIILGGIGKTPADEIEAIIRKSIDNGINFFDLCTAGASYAPIGRAIQDRWDKVFLQVHFGAV